MIHSYTLQGLSCESCVAKVRTALLGVPGVSAVVVTRTPPLARVTMPAHIPTPVLTKAVAAAGAYTLTDMMGYASELEAPSDNVPVQAATKDSLKPIYLIFGYVAGVATLTQLGSGGFDAMAWMGHFMAGFFLVFSFFKLLNVRGFAEGYSTYDVVARRLPAYGLIYPFIELALGIAYLVAPMSLLTNAATLVVMGISSIGVIQQVLQKSPFQCACLGTIFKLPLSKVTLVEDLLMVAMSGVMLVIMLVP